MKVLHLIDSGGLYGAEMMILALVREQCKLGLKPMILSVGEPCIDRKPIEKEAMKLGIPVTPWRMKAGLNIPGNWKILQWAKEQGYEVLHSHGFKFNVLMGMLPRSLRNIPLITSLHGYVHSRPFTRSWVYEKLDRLAIHRSDAVVLVGEAMISKFNFRFYKPKLLQVIPNGIDVEALKEKANSALPPDISRFLVSHPTFILGVGRFSHEKGFDILLKAFSDVKKKVPNAGLVIVGEGALRGQFEKIVNDLDIQGSVYLPGYVECVPALMKNADLFVMPSSTEGLPISLLEALALKLPVLATPVGDIPNVLKDGEYGSILSHRTPEKLSEMIVDAVLDKSDECQLKALKGYQDVVLNRSSLISTQGYVELYRKVCFS